MDNFSISGKDCDEPVEYRQGFADFCECKIDLSRKVLIPRPETEFWVSAAIADLQKAGKNPRILDIFAGSGCAGVATAKKIPGARVDFADIDPEAIEQIKINVSANNIKESRVKIFGSNVFDNIPQDSRYDAILANPPYIDPARIGEVQRSVLDYEPHNALFAKDEGMEFIKKLLNSARAFLNPKGFIYLEFDPSQKDNIENLLEGSEYSSFNFYKDQFDVWRFAKIMR